MSRIPVVGDWKTGRFCDLMGIGERAGISAEADLRLPEYRREVFLRFYEVHLKYRAHPGLAYAVLPRLTERMGMDEEQKLWFAYINGNSQNPVMSWILFSRYPSAVGFLNGGPEWFNANWGRLQWDVDRRYQKKDLPANVEWYHRAVCLSPGGQFGYFSSFDCNFQKLWKHVRAGFPTFGRLSAFSYLEYLRIQGVDVECDDLFLEDLSGSRSHRNGIAKVLGRDDLDFVDKDPKYAPGQVEWLKEEAETLLAEAQERFQGCDFYHDVGYFTLESALCTYKSWHRENRRYTNVYSDMLHDRIRWAETKWPELDFSLFWDIRRESLPPPFRLEDNPRDVGVKPEKQNHYRLTGRPVMLGYAWPELWSQYDTMVSGQSAVEWHGAHDSL